MIWRRCALLLGLAALGACGGPGQAAATPLPGSSQRPPAVASPSPRPVHVFLIVMENHSLEAAMGQPYTASLAGTYALLTNYHAVAHPSLPNYLALSSGSTWGVTDDAYHAIAGQGLGDQLTAAGLSWRAYEEGMTRGCFQSPEPYVIKHNPFAYYGGACPPNVVDSSRLDSDLAGDTPRFSWIQPDLCHSTHSCPLQDGDAWLSQVVPKITASAAWTQGGVLFITWDEDDGTPDNHVATLVVAPKLASHQSATPYDHYSLLATIQDRLELPRTGQALQAQAIKDVF